MCIAALWAGFSQKHTLRPGFKFKEFSWEVTSGIPGRSGVVGKEWNYKRSATEHCGKCSSASLGTRGKLGRMYLTMIFIHIFLVCCGFRLVVWPRKSLQAETSGDSSPLHLPSPSTDECPGKQYVLQATGGCLVQ